MRSRALITAAIVALVAAPAAAEVGYLLPELNIPFTNSDPISGSFDVRLSVSGAEAGMPASAFAVELDVDSTGVVFGDATGPTNALFSGAQTLNFSGSSQKVQAAQDLFSSNPGSAPLADGKGLVTVPFTISTPTIGDYLLSFSGLNELTDDAGSPYTLDVSDTGSISIFLGGDYNRDGSVDAADYTVWRDNLDTVVSPYAGADGDGDGTVDADDYLVWRDQYGASVASPGATAFGAPEPGALCLAALGGLAGGCRRRR